MNFLLINAYQNPYELRQNLKDFITKCFVWLHIGNVNKKEL